MTGKSFRFENVDKVQRQLRAMPDAALLALKGALYQEASVIQTKSIKLAPVDLGVLQNSSFVQKPVVKRTKVTVELGYGGLAKAYALAVHETPSKYSPRSWKKKEKAGGIEFTSGGPKFLERPTNEAEKGFGRRIGRIVEQRLRRVV